MFNPGNNSSNEIDAMLRNAELRNELEPFYDESIVQVEESHLPIEVENDYLEMMLAWEVAPVLPISQWFNPPLKPVHPSKMTAEELHTELYKLINLLFGKQIVLDFTNHLSDKELYLLICHDILPSQEKMLAIRDGYLHWDCADVSGNQEVWLMYYASDEDREHWEEVTEEKAPPKQIPPFSRVLPTDEDIF